LGEPATAGFDYRSVQLHLDYLSQGVLQSAAQAAAVAAADDEHPLWLGQGDESRVHHHLVIDKLVRLRGLEGAIEDQSPAEGDGVQHTDALIV
jgi:hypothetical protein